MDFDQILRYFKQILDSIVIKYGNEANKNETEESLLNYERYKLCKHREDRLASHSHIPYDILISAGLSDDEANAYEYEPTKIPDMYAETVLSMYRDFIVNDFETGGTFEGEVNTYYRMLMGRPPITDGEDDFFYASYDLCEKYPSIDDETPIHLLDNASIEILKDEGFIAQLIKDNPNAKYLRFLGSNAIPLETSRDAKNFVLLRCTKDLPRNLYDNFISLYSAARDYILQVYYIPEFETKYPGYDRFISMMISMTALLKIVTRLFYNIIDSDYFDIKSIISFFNSYKIPYVKNLEFDYQKAMAANLKYLIRMRAEDQALKEVASTIGFKDSKLTRYYIVKEHVMNGKEEPVFYYKDVTDENGETHRELDYEKTYNVYFQQISIDEKNIQLALSEKQNTVSYEELTNDDPYWIDDEELRNLIYQSDYNYELTKYIGLTTSYKFSEIMFDVLYTTRTIVDLKNSSSNVTISLKDISDEPIPIFDLIIFLICCNCKQTGLSGKIPTDASKTSIVVGFNFANIQQIRQMLFTAFKDGKLTEEEYRTISSYTNKDTIITPNDVNTIYNNIKGLKNYFIKKMEDASSIEELRFYKGLYYTIFYTEENAELFRMSNGEIANTYLDYLKDLNYTLYAYFIGMNETEIHTAAEYVVNKLSAYMKDIHYFSMINKNSDEKNEIFAKFINIFKSYTIDLASINMTYNITDKSRNSINMKNSILTSKSIIIENELAKDHSHTVGINKRIIADGGKLFKKDGIAAVIYND